jgi:hypothetical protein
LIELEAITTHAHYDSTGARVMHAPGERFTLHDSVGLTAAELAARLIGQGLAKRVEAKPKAAAKAGK